MTFSKRLFAEIGPCREDRLQNSNDVATLRRKLTSKGPRVAYELFRASQLSKGQVASSTGTGTNIPNTVNIASSEGVAHSIHNVWSRHDHHETEVSSRSVVPKRVPDSARCRTDLPVRGNTPAATSASAATSAQNDKDINDQDESEEIHVGAFDRLHHEALKSQVKEYRQTITNLQKIQTKMLHKVTELPRQCRWECVAKVLTDIVSSLMIGNESTCTLYPSEMEIVPRILSSFGIGMEQQDEVEQFFTEWGKGGHSSIMMKVYANIRDRRGAILRVLREEFYTQLDLPKPRDGEGDAFDDWKKKLAEFKRNKLWRIDTEGAALDPWGGRAVHHSISRVLMGIRYDIQLAVTINLRQARFFFYNLQLVVDGKVMEASRMHLHHKGMREMEENVKRCRINKRRIIVID